MQGKTSVYILKLRREIGQSFIEQENIREDKLVKNIEIFWMNAKTVIELGFRMKDYADLGDCYLPSLISKILRVILSRINNWELPLTRLWINIY